MFVSKSCGFGHASPHRCCVCVQQVEEQKQQDESKEEMMELRSWNQQKDDYEDDTQVNTNPSVSATLALGSVWACGHDIHWEYWCNYVKAAWQT